MMQQAQWDMDWELLGKPHMQGYKNADCDVFNRIKVFSLLYVVIAMIH